MCGIAGIINFDGAPVNRENVHAMTEIQFHRGPDAVGYYFNGCVGLGHRRLSIIDLEGGRQPMHNEDRTIWITYNGEIYNFKEIGKELSARGHLFNTKSDTEVIIHAYEEWGEACLEKFIGMFAFVLWDCRRRKIFVARDRLGIKPFYYYIDKGKFVFASELKAFSYNNSIVRTIDETALIAYLRFGYVPAPFTIYRHIKKLLPGHYLSIELKDNREVQQQKYWELRFEPSDSISFEEWKDKLFELLRDSVRIRMISDVPLGAFLSGGVDSSIIVGLMSQESSNRVKTFSIGFEEEDYSELEYARIISKQFNTDHHELIVKPDAIELLPELARQFDEPFADSSAIPTYYVSKMARREVKVVLSGDGGDELFAGYDHYRVLKRFSNYEWIPYLIRRSMFAKAISIIPENTKGRGFCRRISLRPFELALEVVSIFPEPIINKILSEDLKQQNEQSIYRTYYERFEKNSSDVISKMQYTDIGTYLPDDILVKVDRASMLNSLEVRIPILDHRMVELAAIIPVDYKFKKNEKKHILKETFKKIVPHEVLYRPKKGFAVPLEHWLRGQLFDFACEMLLSRDCLVQEFINLKHVRKLLFDHQEQRTNNASRIWSLLFLEQWLKIWRNPR